MGCPGGGHEKRERRHPIRSCRPVAFFQELGFAKPWANDGRRLENIAYIDEWGVIFSEKPISCSGLAAGPGGRLESPPQFPAPGGGSCRVAAALAYCLRANLSEPLRALPGAISAGWLDRSGRPSARQPIVRAVGPAAGDREPGRRGRQHRSAGGRAITSRWLYPVHRHELPCHQPLSLIRRRL